MSKKQHRGKEVEQDGQMESSTNCPPKFNNDLHKKAPALRTKNQAGRSGSRLLVSFLHPEFRVVNLFLNSEVCLLLFLSIWDSSHNLVDLHCYFGGCDMSL